MSSGLDFLIVGTPRSGTSLVQRLLSDHPDVAVPPETHFFGHYASDVHRRRVRFPLSGDDLADEIERYRSLPTSKGIHLEVESMCDRLSGHCASSLAMFEALVRTLSPDASCLGEKTPGHLLVAQVIATLWPTIRVIAVVRDPRAVVASQMRVPWAADCIAVMAESWRRDEIALRRLEKAIPDRTIVIRYEDLVADPKMTCDQMMRFLGLGAHDRSSSPRISGIVGLEWETWKRRASEPIDDSRVASWREELTVDEVELVDHVCGRGISRLGYDRLTRTQRRFRQELSHLRHSACRVRYVVARWHLRRRVLKVIRCRRYYHG